MFIALTPDQAIYCKSICVLWNSVCSWGQCVAHRMPNPSSETRVANEGLHARSGAIQSQTALPMVTAILIEKHLSHFSICHQFLGIGKALLFNSPGQCKMSIFFCLKVKVSCKLQAATDGDPYRLFESFESCAVFSLL